MRTVVFSLLGSQLDAARPGDVARWQRWRPNVALCQHEDLLVDRLELWHDARHAALAEQVVADVALVSPETEVRTTVLGLADPWDFEEVYGRLYDLVDTYRFDAARERYLVNLTTGTHVAQICWFLLAESRALPAELLQLAPPRVRREAAKGASDGAKGGEGSGARGGPSRARRASPAGRWQTIDLDLSRYDRIATRFARRADEDESFLKAGIVTRNADFNAMIGQIERVVIRSRAPVLLLGPTGAGKSSLARRIHELKRARYQIAGDFVEVNCATLRGEHAMSALFGHVKGAFTGAVADRPGLLRAADGGLLFLDEIGELGLDEQAMILRAIEDRRFVPVGSDREAASDFLLIAGTNRDLRAEARAGRFRQDLLARLDLWTYELPGLAGRREDIEPNLDFELLRHAEATGDRADFNREARRRYLAFARSPRASWRGNFRDLGASVTRMATLAPRGRITEAIVGAEIGRLERGWGPDESDAGAADDEAVLAAALGEEALAEVDLFDRAQLAAVVRTVAATASLGEAGRRLFAASRTRKASSNDSDRLQKYLARFGLTRAGVVEAVAAAARHG